MGSLPEGAGPVHRRWLALVVLAGDLAAEAYTFRSLAFRALASPAADASMLLACLSNLITWPLERLYAAF